MPHDLVSPPLEQLSLLADEAVPSPRQVVRQLLRAVPALASVSVAVPAPSARAASPPADAAVVEPTPLVDPSRAAPRDAGAVPGDRCSTNTSHVADVFRKPVPRPESLHPALWLGHQIGRHAEDAIPTGFAALDLQLPGGGWPRRVLTELLLPHAGVGEIRLLSPCLAALQRAGRLLMLFDPPEALCGWALAELGLDVQQLLVIQTRTRVLPGADSLWALEQALKSGHVGAVLAWLPPRLRAERLRRLQLAAHAHDGPAFVFRETSASQRPTAAPLRLALKTAGADVMSLRVLKRRGPPLELPLKLTLPSVLSGRARRRADEMRASRGDAPRAGGGLGDALRASGLTAHASTESSGVHALARASFVDLTD